MKRPRSCIGRLVVPVLLLFPSAGRFVHASRAYPLGCSQEAPSFFDYENGVFPPPDIPVMTANDFVLIRKLGSGKFSDVFEAMKVVPEDHHHHHHDNADKEKDNHNSKQQQRKLVVIKCLKPVSDRKVRREVLILTHASKLPNCARVLGIVIPKDFEPQNDRPPSTKRPMPSIVMEHAGANARWFCHGRGRGQDAFFLTEYEIKYYLYHLLVALDALHSLGIMHRDVKPRNVLMSTESLTLVDMGLAEFYKPKTQYNVRVASRHYKSPELLIGYEYYDYAIDMWSVGCMLAGLLLRIEPFFRGKDNVDQLGLIVAVLGTSDFLSYCRKCNLDLTVEMRKTIAKYTFRNSNLNGGRRKSWLDFVREGNPPPNRDGLDLLDKLLVYDHDLRLTAKEAMQHAFFDEVRELVEKEVEEQKRAMANVVESDEQISMTTTTTTRPEEAEDVVVPEVVGMESLSCKDTSPEVPEDVVEPEIVSMESLSRKDTKRILSKMLDRRSDGGKRAGPRR